MHLVFWSLLKGEGYTGIAGYGTRDRSETKTVRTEKIVKMPIKNRRQRILGQAFGTDRERVKPFREDDRGEDRRFKTSLPGFGYREEEHEASRYLSKTVATVILSPKYQIVIPREMRDRLNIKPGQKVSVTAKDGVVHIVPIRPWKELKGIGFRGDPESAGEPTGPLLIFF